MMIEVGPNLGAALVGIAMFTFAGVACWRIMR